MDGLTQRRKNIYTGCVFVAIWLLASIHSAAGVLQSSIISAFSLSDSAKGLPSSVNAVSSMCAFCAIILFIGRVRKPAILLAGSLLSAVSLFFITRNVPYGAFLCMLAFVGFSCGCIDSVTSASIAQLHPGEKGAGLMCALHATYGLAGFSMPFLFEALKGGDGGAWRSVYGLLSGFALAAGVLIFLASFRRMRALEAPGADKARFSKASVARVFSNPCVRMMLLSMLFMGMNLNGILIWTPRYMELGLNSPLKTLVLSAVYLGITLSRLVMAFVRVKMFQYMRMAIPLAAVALLAGILVKNDVFALACIFISSALTGPVMPFSICLACKEEPGDGFLMTGALLLASFCGQMIFAPVFGKVESTWGISSAMILCACVTLICGVCMAIAARRENAR